MLEIVTIPNPILRQKAKKIEQIDDDVQNLIDAMLETLEKNPRGGVGLAAPQVGFSRRLLLAKNSREKDGKMYPLINPEITNRSQETGLAFEGCLSIPEVWGQVERSLKIIVKAENRMGKKITLKAAGFFARVLQHEVDHLDGILITDKMVGKTLTEKEFDELAER